MRTGSGIVLAVSFIRILLYAVAGPNYGYFRDELYYLACGEHPAWGYVDQPPLIGWVAWAIQHTTGGSIWAIRFLPALAGAATIFLTGSLARELGGGRWSMFLAAVAGLGAPIFLAISHLFTMNAFDPLFWTALAFLVVRIAKTGDERLWLWVGALTGVTILNKYAVVFWISGLFAGLLLTPLRSHLRNRWVWGGAAIAAAIAFPNFLWQWGNDFPFLELMENVRRSGRDVSLSPLPYLKAQAEMLGYVSATLVVFALVYFFSKRGRIVRVLGWAYLVFLLEMMVLRGKMYYLAPVYPLMFAAGAVWIESVTERARWVRFALASAIGAAGVLFAPTMLPILDVPTFLAFQKATGIEQQKFENQRLDVLPQLYADMFGWEEMAKTVGDYFSKLSPEEQRRTAIFGNNFGESAAIDFFGPRYGLPKSVGNHQTYWLWGPRQYTRGDLIVLGDDDERNMQTKCESYSVIGNGKHPLSRPDEWLPIYHCRGFKWSLPEFWRGAKHWD